MTIGLLTLILLTYMKITGKSLPAVENRLNKVKNSKRKVVTNISTIKENEVATLGLDKVESVSFKKYQPSQVYPKFYSGSLKI